MFVIKKTAAEAFGDIIKKANKLKGINISDCNLEKEENAIVLKALSVKFLVIKLNKGIIHRIKENRV